jgi:hypothetical protein
MKRKYEDEDDDDFESPPKKKHKSSQEGKHFLLPYTFQCLYNTGAPALNQLFIVGE